MASMNLQRAAMFNLWKAFPRGRAQPSLTSSRQVSRVRLASSFSQFEGRDPVENARDSRADLAYESKKWREQSNGKASDDTSSEDTSDDEAEGNIKRRGKEKVSDYARAAKDKTNKAADKAYEAKEKTKEKSSEAQDKAKEYVERARGKASEAVDKGQDTKERAKEYAGETKEEVKKGTQKAKQGAEEYVNDVKEKAKGTVKGAWEATKDTARKMTEAVVGPDDEKNRVDVEDLTKKTAKDGE